jgi:integrase
MTELSILPKDLSNWTSFIANESNAGTKKRKIYQTTYFYLWLVERYSAIETILDVTPIQLREYFQWVDTSVHALLDVKSKYKTSLKQYIYWIITPQLAAGEQIKYNYEVIFKDSFYTMKNTGTHRSEEPLTKQDVLDCINFFRERNERDYIMVCLLAYTGMRVGGLMNLELRNINFDLRCLLTQEKRTRAHNGINKYAIPPFFVRILKAYVTQLQALYPTQTHLIPICSRVIRKQLKKWRSSIHPHLFRDAINSRWSEAGMDIGFRSILLNQKPPNVNTDNYQKFLRSWNARIEIYDKFFPY